MAIDLHSKHSKLLRREGLVLRHLQAFVFVLTFFHRGKDAGVGISKKSKSQAKEDKGKFFHIDKIINDGRKDRKK